MTLVRWGSWIDMWLEDQERPQVRPKTPWPQKVHGKDSQTGPGSAMEHPRGAKRSKVLDERCMRVAEFPEGPKSNMVPVIASGQGHGAPGYDRGSPKALSNGVTFWSEGLLLVFLFEGIFCTRKVLRSSFVLPQFIQQLLMIIFLHPLGVKHDLLA